MAKNANPMDAHRKALRKKELKRNKDDRKKGREIAIVKKDTRSIENDIKRLSQAASKGPLSATDRTELSSLRDELAKINKAKNEYVEAHPEHRKFVFPERKEASTSASQDNDGPGLYTKDGKLKDPQRSFYYDPVFNPFGAPPPGMPYRERLPTAEELAALQAFQAIKAEDSDEDSSDEDDDDDIVMPEGPPPEAAGSDHSSSDDDDDDEDDIAMPSGPPPSSIPAGPKNPYSRPTPMIARPSIPLPPTPRFPPNQQNRNFPPQHQPCPPNPLPPRPHAATLNDPLTAHLPPKPTFQALQAQRQQQHQPPQPQTLPPAVPTSSAPPPPALPFPNAIPTGGSASATISAAPQLRDLKKEATAFMPSAMRKKKPVASSAAVKIDAAPGGPVVGGERASLKDALSGVGIAGGDKGKAKEKDAGKEDYELFQKQMQGFL